jgi:VWFA-related protein
LIRIIAVGISLIALAQAPAGSELASVYITVRNGKGQLVAEVKPQDLKVSVGGKEFEPRSVTPAISPMDIGVILDASTGVIPTLQTEAEAASAFFHTVMRPGDLGFTIGYNSHVDVLQAPAEDTRLLARNTARVTGYGRYVATPQRKAIPIRPIPTPLAIPLPMPLPGKPPVARPLPPEPVAADHDRGGGDRRSARLYDALIHAANRFVTREGGRSVFVVFALSDDANSQASLEDALRALKKKGVTVYVLQAEPERPSVGAIISGVLRRATVIRRDDVDLQPVFTNAPGNRMARLAEETGGRVIHVKGFDKAQQAFAQIAEDLRRQQRVTFAPPAQAEDDGAERSLEIETRIKGGHVYAPNAYYSTPVKRP